MRIRLYFVLLCFKLVQFLRFANRNDHSWGGEGRLVKESLEEVSSEPSFEGSP